MVSIALCEISHYEKAFELVTHKLPFQRLAQNSKRVFRARLVLCKDAAEAYLGFSVEDTNLGAVHAEHPAERHPVRDSSRDAIFVF